MDCKKFLWKTYQNFCRSREVNWLKVLMRLLPGTLGCLFFPKFWDRKVQVHKKLSFDVQIDIQKELRKSISLTTFLRLVKNLSKHEWLKSDHIRLLNKKAHLWLKIHKLGIFGISGARRLWVFILSSMH